MHKGWSWNTFMNIEFENHHWEYKGRVLTFEGKTYPPKNVFICSALVTIASSQLKLVNSKLKGELKLELELENNCGFQLFFKSQIIV
jgi:hypothetical protein